MYYSYKCPYCGREFYTYNTNREQASQILYFSIKQHLIDYNEDHKEHELDDGESEDSDQIYEQMKESSHKPPGGYEASLTSLKETQSTHEPTTHSSSSSLVLILFLVVIIIIIIAAFFLFPHLFTPFSSFFP